MTTNSDPGSLGAAAQRIRDSAKWLLASFAVVGAALAAGLQLTGLGKLDNSLPDHRLFWAFAATGCVLVGVIVAISAASRIVTKSFVTLEWLADSSEARKIRDGVDKDHVLLAGFGSIGELRDVYQRVLSQRNAELLQYLEVVEATQRQTAKSAFEATQTYATLVSQTVDHVLERASFDRIREAYDGSKIVMGIGAAIAGIGIIAFAWASNPPSIDLVPTVQAVPTEVIVHINADEQSTVRSKYPELGKCDLEAMDAVALSVEGAEYDLTTVPSASCNVTTTFQVSASQGTIVPEESVVATPTTDASDGCNRIPYTKILHRRIHHD
jgi:hypothetical protein